MWGGGPHLLLCLRCFSTKDAASKSCFITILEGKKGGTLFSRIVLPKKSKQQKNNTIRLIALHYLLTCSPNMAVCATSSTNPWCSLPEWLATKSSTYRQ